MNLTSIFRLRKPEGTDPVNVEDFNDNFDVIDTELNKRPEKTGNASDMVTTFSQAASRANLTPGEKISVSFGKIMKFFADLKAVAFTGSYADLSNKPSIPGGAAASQAVANNCTTTAAGSVLDARQGKVLMDKANQINSDLGSSLNGCKLTYEGGDFYAAYGAVKKKLGSQILSAGPFTGSDYDVKAAFPAYYADRVLGQNLFFTPTRFYAGHSGATFGVNSSYNNSTGILSVRSDVGGINGAYIYILV